MDGVLKVLVKVAWNEFTPKLFDIFFDWFHSLKSTWVYKSFSKLLIDLKM